MYKVSLKPITVMEESLFNKLFDINQLAVQLTNQQINQPPDDPYIAPANFIVGI